MTRHTFDMPEAQADRIHKMVRSEIATMKNHIAMYVETDRPDKAKELVADLRNLEEIFKAFNMDAKRERAERNKEPIVTEHTVGWAY